MIILPDDDQDPLLSVSPSVKIARSFATQPETRIRDSPALFISLSLSLYLSLSLLSLLDFFFFLLFFLLLYFFPRFVLYLLPNRIHGCERLNDYSISRCHGHTLKRSEKNRYDSSQQERVTLSKGWTNQLLYPTPRKALEAEAPNVHEQRSVIAYFERGKGEEVVGKELTTNYEFEHHRP